MAASKKRVMDVSKPGKTPATATSRPLIVGHGSKIQDPMVKDDAADAADKATAPELETKDSTDHALPARRERTIKPVGGDSSVAEANAAPKGAANNGAKTAAPLGAPGRLGADDSSDSASSTDDTGEDQAASGDDADNSEAAAVDAVASQASSKKIAQDEAAKAEQQQQALQKLIDEKKYFVRISRPRHQRNIAKLVAGIVAVCIAAVSLYVSIDAGVFGDKISVPWHVLPQPDSSDSTETPPAPADDTAKKDEEPKDEEPKDPDLRYVNRELGLGFDYPEAWGEVNVVPRQGSVDDELVVAYQLQFADYDDEVALDIVPEGWESDELTLLREYTAEDDWAPVTSKQFDASRHYFVNQPDDSYWFIYLTDEGDGKLALQDYAIKKLPLQAVKNQFIVLHGSGVSGTARLIEAQDPCLQPSAESKAQNLRPTAECLDADLGAGITQIFTTLRALE
ncbi:hypothetical protein CR970_02645 [Candidatus Saccharibacteria bacterium]|nr:MAG: hypothetical protein CR970_02645 [Candidatus Saccharibacteria bacterium]